MTAYNSIHALLKEKWIFNKTIELAVGYGGDFICKFLFSDNRATPVCMNEVALWYQNRTF